MNLYLLMNMFYLAAYLFLTSLSFYQIEKIEGKNKYRMKIVWALLIMLPLILFAWQREQYFGDTNAYTRMMGNLPSGLMEFKNYLVANPKDPGFTVFCWIVKSLGGDDRLMFLIVALFQGLVVALIYRKYSCNYLFSILLFLLSTDYYSWMQNGMRQFIAVTIIFAATPLILNKRYVPTILIILFASLFHQSALLMIPVVFLVQGRPLNTRMLIVAGIIFLSVAFLGLFTNVLDGILQSTQYENVVTDYQVGEFSHDDGTNPIRVLIYSVPFILAIIKLKMVEWVDSPIINLSVNMSVLTCGIYIISMFTSGIFLGRIPIYFSLYNYILLPWEIKYFFPKRDGGYVRLLCIAGYLVFNFIQLKMVWNVF